MLNIKYFKYREISDSEPDYSNLSISIKMTRLIIRLIINLFSFKNTIKIMKAIIFVFKNTPFFNTQNCQYLININLYKIKFLSHLSQNNFIESLSTKIEWSNYVLNNSSCNSSSSNAEAFIELINNNICIDHAGSLLQAFSDDRDEEMFNVPMMVIEGPTANEMDIKEDVQRMSTLVHLKPFTSDLSSYKYKILYLNSFFYKNKVENDLKYQSELLKCYDKIYVSCSISKLPNFFTRLPRAAEGNISSPMALGRVIQHLTTKISPSIEVKFIVNGFDLYLSKDPYSRSSYIKLTRNVEALIEERELCLSLAEHDLFYNFMYLRFLSSKISIINSPSFSKIMNMKMSEYLEELASSRNFKSLIK
tara:strand:+ start:123 stop:1211 length:1089 start_codon:yes stop_codon:yes gene_type:complete